MTALGVRVRRAKECIEVCGLYRRKMGRMRMVRSGFFTLVWIFRISTSAHAASSSARKFLFTLLGIVVGLGLGCIGD